VGGAPKLYAGEKALSSINHSILSGVMYATRTYTIELVVYKARIFRVKESLTVDS
jgi:hypothetical protein